VLPAHAADADLVWLYFAMRYVDSLPCSRFSWYSSSMDLKVYFNGRVKPIFAAIFCILLLSFATLYP
jgi:hypothetical protein